jgi:hypothetical protein
MSACSTTVEATPAAAKQLESGGTLPPDVTGFMGEDASKLGPGPQGGAALTYINPNAQWSKYTRIQLLPVEFWAARDSTVSADDQHTLTTYFYNQIKDGSRETLHGRRKAGPGHDNSTSGPYGCDYRDTWTAQRISRGSANENHQCRSVDGDR